MQIHEFSFSNIRGVANFHLADIPDRGVVVISGENEAGKSTIMEALWTVLFQKHKAGNKDVLAMQPAGQDVPMRIELTATVGPVKFRLVKQYLKSRKAELLVMAPQRATYTGGDAEAQLEAILNEHLDRTLLETLFVRQGDVDAAFAAAGIPSLAQALNSADATDAPQGPEDTGLIEAAAKEYDRYFTAGGKPKAELKDALQAFESAVTALDDAQAKQASLESEVAAYGRDQLIFEENSAKIPEAENDVARSAEALAQARELQAKVTAAQNEVEHARTLVEASQRELERREEQRAAVAKAKEVLAELTAMREPLAREVEEHRAKLTASKKSAETAEEAETQARSQLSDIRRDIDAVQKHNRVRELREFAQEIESKDKEISQRRSELPVLLVSSNVVRKAEELQSDLAVAEAKVEALSAKLRLHSKSPSTIVIDGEDVDIDVQPQERVLHSASTIVIGDVTAEFVPERSNENALADLHKAQSALAELYQEYGVASLAELRELASAHAQLEADIAKFETERRALIGSKDLRLVKREIEDLERALAGTDIPKLDLAQLRDEESELAQSLNALEQQLRSARVELRSLEAGSKQVELTTADTRIEVATTQLTSLEETLATAEEQTSTEDLRETLASRQEALAAKEEAVGGLLAAGIDVDEAQELLDGERSRLDVLRKSVAEAELRMAERKGNIQRAEGVAEEVLHAKARREAAEQELARVQRRADAAALLLRTLRAHLDAARRRYSAPFVAKLSALSRSLFGAELDYVLDDQLRISQRVIGDTPVDLGALSGGAKEQLALLARCAVAELVDDGAGVPLFIDDALGNTDKQRLVMMNRVLSKLGKQRQVFVLTSMPERFERVTDQTAWTMDELKKS